ncbi:hypothetical protein DM02DRAFT_404949 [Periconia macrospinosa]|uniref:Uncharacterized protein n=1 Tax=Periconia macrospinosa TaxID=97972 RepID=A0A2V1E850_9PLEO|nr:hypothetical protein DM02DRAFT_404949 [Periconia macrospinosa]
MDMCTCMADAVAGCDVWACTVDSCFICRSLWCSAVQCSAACTMADSGGPKGHRRGPLGLRWIDTLGTGKGGRTRSAPTHHLPAGYPRTQNAKIRKKTKTQTQASGHGCWLLSGAWRCLCCDALRTRTASAERCALFVGVTTDPLDTRGASGPGRPPAFYIAALPN